MDITATTTYFIGYYLLHIGVTVAHDNNSIKIILMDVTITPPYLLDITWMGRITNPTYYGYFIQYYLLDIGYYLLAIGFIEGHDNHCKKVILMTRTTPPSYWIFDNF